MTTRPTGPDAGADDGDRSVAAAGRNSGQLTRSIILQAALAIVDADGVDGLSMRSRGSLRTGARQHEPALLSEQWVCAVVHPEHQSARPPISPRLCRTRR